MISNEEIYNELWNALYYHFGSDHDKAAERIRLMDFTNIELKRKDISSPSFTLHLTLRRPGILIGAKGETINAVGEHFKNNFNMKIRVEEATECALADHIIPYNRCYYNDDTEEIW